MAKGPQILTASRLKDGTVVYWQGTGWAEAMAEAEIFEDGAAAKAALASADAQAVVNVYLFEVRIEDSVAVPVKEREVIRAAGPSVRRDLGKQSEAGHAPRFRTGPKPPPPQPVAADGPEAFDVSL